MSRAIIEIHGLVVSRFAGPDSGEGDDRARWQFRTPGGFVAILDRREMRAVCRALERDVYYVSDPDPPAIERGDATPERFPIRPLDRRRAEHLGSAP